MEGQTIIRTTKGKDFHPSAAHFFFSVFSLPSSSLPNQSHAKKILHLSIWCPKENWTWAFDIPPLSNQNSSRHNFSRLDGWSAWTLSRLLLEQNQSKLVVVIKNWLNKNFEGHERIHHRLSEKKQQQQTNTLERSSCYMFLQQRLDFHGQRGKVTAASKMNEQWKGRDDARRKDVRDKVRTKKYLERTSQFQFQAEVRPFLFLLSAKGHTNS